jgi:hypothetical protein
LVSVLSGFCSLAADDGELGLGEVNLGEVKLGEVKLGDVKLSVPRSVKRPTSLVTQLVQLPLANDDSGIRSSSPWLGQSTLWPCWLRFHTATTRRAAPEDPSSANVRAPALLRCEQTIAVSPTHRGSNPAPCYPLIRKRLETFVYGRTAA